jgi:thiol-disulfide isomerase/thioredoxin
LLGYKGKGIQMKKKYYIAGIVCAIIIIGIAAVLLYKNLFVTSENNAYEGLNTIALDEVFEMGGDYYVYAQRSGCPYCDNVKDDIIRFSKSNSLFVLDTQASENETAKDYDWTSHHKKYDEEIGEIVNGEISFYNGLTKKTLKDKYSPLDYTIKVADKDFVELNEGKEIGKIYAVRESPIIDYSNTTKDNFVIAAVPTLYHIKDGKIDDFYFGDAQILNFLGSEKSPLDEYMDLN